MRKKTADTLQQKLGFFDEDLKKPEHDDLMIWLDKNIERILDDVLPKDLRYYLYKDFQNYVNLTIESCIDFYQKKLKTNNDNNEAKNKIDYLKNLTLFDKPYQRQNSIKVIDKKWEVLINAKSKNPHKEFGYQQTVGFIDFAVRYSIPSNPRLQGIRYTTLSYSERSVLNGIGDDVFIDFENESRIMYVEVKTEIRSIGELIRQINLYKSHLPGDYFVLCPDNSKKDILFEQGINFIEYDGK